jgi:hypothetical protein
MYKKPGTYLNGLLLVDRRTALLASAPSESVAISLPCLPKKDRSPGSRLHRHSVTAPLSARRDICSWAVGETLTRHQEVTWGRLPRRNSDFDRNIRPEMVAVGGITLGVPVADTALYLVESRSRAHPPSVQDRKSGPRSHARRLYRKAFERPPPLPRPSQRGPDHHHEAGLLASATVSITTSHRRTTQALRSAVASACRKTTVSSAGKR